MAELEEKLNAILGNQEAMGQIMALARSLSGGQEGGQLPGAAGPEAGGAGEEPDGGPGGPPADDLSQLLGQLDPELIRKGLAIVRQVREGEDRSADLLRALRPFVREDRRGRLDRAVELTRTARLIRAVLGAAGKGAREGV